MPLPETTLNVWLVDRASEKHMDWLIGQLKAFSAIYASKLPLFGDEDYARNALAVLIKDHLVLVAEKNFEPVGFIAGLVTPHFFNPDIRVLSETFWWVAPEHRRSRAGALLLQKFVQWGEMNADWITCALEAHSPVNPDALLKRGFVLQERSFLMEVA